MTWIPPAPFVLVLGVIDAICLHVRAAVKSLGCLSATERVKTETFGGALCGRPGALCAQARCARLYRRPAAARDPFTVVGCDDRAVLSPLVGHVGGSGAVGLTKETELLSVRDMVIDAYAHVFPMPLIDALSEVSSSAELTALRSQSPHLYDDERRIRFMDEHQLDVQVLVLARPPVWLGMEREVLHRLTRVANDSIAEFASRRPDRFVGVGVLPVVDDVMIEEFERLRGELGLKGVLIFSNIEGRPVDDPSMWPLYERAAAADVPIWIHPQHASYYSWIGNNVLDRTLGWPFDTSLAIIPSGKKYHIFSSKPSAY